MPENSRDTGIFTNPEHFQLKVENIVYTILNTRDLTVNEVRKIQEAIRASIEMLLTQHHHDCQRVMKTDLQEMKAGVLGQISDISKSGIDDFIFAQLPEIIETHFDSYSNAFKKEFLKEIKELFDKEFEHKMREERLNTLKEAETRRKEEDSKYHRKIGLIIAGVSVSLAVLQVILRFFV